jgi:hypothetical protein
MSSVESAMAASTCRTVRMASGSEFVSSFSTSDGSATEVSV